MMFFLKAAPWFVICGFFAFSSAAADRVALVIGNARYVAVDRLDNPGNDARAVASALEEHGFQVSSALDLGREQMTRMLRDFREQADAAEIALVYYAGHGIEVQGENYLIPTDARLQDERDAPGEAIELGYVMDQISGARTLGMVVLDACRDNPFANQMRAVGRGRSVGRGLSEPPPSAAGTLVMYAAAAGAVTPDGDPGGNSPFTAAFLDALKGPPRDVRLMLGAVKDGVRSRVGEAADPYVYESLGGSEIIINRGGDETFEDRAVADARRGLIELGEPLAATGPLDSSLAGAISSFQSENGLAATGLPDERTLGALQAAVAYQRRSKGTEGNGELNEKDVTIAGISGNAVQRSPTVDVEYRRSVSLGVGESIVVHGARGACGQPPPSWQKVSRKLPDTKLGSWSDGGVGMRYSRKCGTMTPARGLVFNARRIGSTEFYIYGDPVSISVD